MTNKLPYTLFLAVLLVATTLTRAQPASDEICLSCIDPNGTAIPTCTSTPTPTPTPVPINPHKGVAGSNGLLETNSQFGYNWAPLVAPGNDYERIPMIRDWDDLTDQILSQLTITNTTAVVGGNSDYLMLFNEPDIAPPAGSGMTVDEVVAGQAIAESLFPDLLLVSPAYSQNAYPRLQDVYERHYEVYHRYPRWDVVAYHCYFVDSASTCMPVLNWMISFADRIESDTGSRPEIWNSEFAALATTGSAGPNWAPAVASGSAYIDTMEALGVDRYLIFSHCQDWWSGTYACELAYPDGSLTPLGEMYLLK